MNILILGDIVGPSGREALIKKLPIHGVIGDQQSAAIGQFCFNEGDIKSTYGTGSFVLLNTGKNIVHSNNTF